MEIAALIIVLVSAALLAAASFGAVLAAGRFWRVPYPALWFAIGGALAGAEQQSADEGCDARSNSKATPHGRSPLRAQRLMHT